MKEFAGPLKKIIEGFKRYITPNISDALDRLGIQGDCQGIRSAVEGLKMVGPAFTIYRLPSDPVNPKKAGIISIT